MKTSLHSTIRTLTSLVGAALFSSASASAETYTIQIINPPTGTASFAAQSLNGLGQVVGSTKVKVGKNTVFGPAFIWDNGQAKTLPALSGQASTEATGISDSSLIVGGPTLFTSLETGRRPTWWEKTPTGYLPHDWNVVPGLAAGVTLLRANSLSHDGRFISFQANLGTLGQRDIVAEIQLEANGLLPVRFVAVWDITSVWGVTDIHHNGVGLVRAVGLGGPDLDTPGAFLWLKELNGNTQLIDLHSPVNQYTEAWSVNGFGEVAGLRRNSGVDRAVYWNQNGLIQDIGTLGGTEASAGSINDFGKVVGWAYTGGRKSVSHAFLWDSSTGMRDLNGLKSPTDTSGLELTSALKINNAGQILAGGTSKTLGSKIVLLKPVAAP